MPDGARELPRVVILGGGFAGLTAAKALRRAPVEITLRPIPSGTELQLVHRGLSTPMAEQHQRGWTWFLDRLADVAVRRADGP